MVVKGFELNSSIMDKTKLEMIKKRVNHIFNLRLSESMRRKVNDLLERIRVLEKKNNDEKEERITNSNSPDE